MAQKTILVTGGAGFIGSHLVDRFVVLGHKVHVVDDLSAGKHERLNKGATFHHLSINAPALADVFQREHPNVVVHLAAQASVVASTRQPDHDADINVIGTIRLLEYAKASGVERFIYSSTGGALYGDPKKLPCEETDPIAPLSPYGMSKYCSELYIDLFRRLHKLNAVVLRYGNVYGPRQDPHGEAGVVAIFGRLMLSGKQPTIFGDGKQERDFVYVGDIVDANVRALDAGDGRVYNIGSGQPTSVNRIFQALKGIIQFKGEAAYAPARSGEVFRIYLTPSRAQKELGWKAKTSLDDGLRRTVEHIAEGMKASA